MNDEEFFAELSVPERNKIFDRQMELAVKGRGKDEDFVMAYCWQEAVTEYRKKHKI